MHTVEITLDWGLLGTLSKLDRFDVSWLVIGRWRSLNQLKAIATVRNAGVRPA